MVLRRTESGVQADKKSGAAATVAAAPEDTLIKRVMYWRTANLSEPPKEARRHAGRMQNAKCASCSPSKRPLRRC